MGLVMAEDNYHKSEDFDHKSVALVATTIGGVVLLLGLVGIMVNLL